MIREPAAKFTTQAVVLRRYALGEADRLVVMLTKDFGMVRAVAKGLRRSQKRFGGQVDLLNHLQVELSRRKKAELWVLESAKLVHAFYPLSEKVMTFAAGCHLAEVAGAFATEAHADPGAFTALIAALDALSRDFDPAPVGRVLELHVLRAAGLTPSLETCLLTGRRLADDETAVFSPRHGGTIALTHDTGREALLLSPASRRLMILALTLDLESALALPWTAEALAEARQALAAMIVYYTGRPLRARGFAEEAARFTKKFQGAPV